MILLTFSLENLIGLLGFNFMNISDKLYDLLSVIYCDGFSLILFKIS